MDDNGANETARQRRRAVIWTGLLLAMVAVSIYLGFIILMGQRG